MLLLGSFSSSPYSFVSFVQVVVVAVVDSGAGVMEGEVEEEEAGLVVVEEAVTEVVVPLKAVAEDVVVIVEAVEEEAVVVEGEE